jgi:hypothetical protein
MTLIGVNKGQITTYASAAETQFGAINNSLKNLMADCVNVEYWGENAGTFKKQVGVAAQTMAQEIGASMKRFITAVNSATSAIARSLGGVDMSIDLTVPSFETLPAPTSSPDDSGANTEALTTLRSTVDSHRDAIVSAVDEHQAALNRTPNWTGNAKDVAVAACQAFTSSVNTSVATGIKTINTYIEEQTTATTTADAVS